MDRGRIRQIEGGFLDARAEAAQNGNGFVEGGGDRRVELAFAGGVGRGGVADAQARQRGRQPDVPGLVGSRQVEGIARIRTGQDGEQSRDVLDAARDGPDMGRYADEVGRRMGDAAERRLESDHAAVGAWHADGASAVGAYGDRAKAHCHRRDRAGTAAARSPGGIPWIARQVPATAPGMAAEAELCGGGGAQDDGTVLA